MYRFVSGLTLCNVAYSLRLGPEVDVVVPRAPCELCSIVMHHGSNVG